MIQAVVSSPRIAFALRTNVGDWHYFRVNTEDMHVEDMSVNHYLAFKEKLVSKHGGASRARLGGWSIFCTRFCHAESVL